MDKSLRLTFLAHQYNGTSQSINQSSMPSIRHWATLTFDLAFR